MIEKKFTVQHLILQLMQLVILKKQNNSRLMDMKIMDMQQIMLVGLKTTDLS